MSAESEQPPSDGEAPKPLRPAVRADANPNLVATAKFIRRLLPGDGSRDGDSLTTSGQLRRRITSQLAIDSDERPSAMRELGLGALQAWDALSEAQRLATDRYRGGLDSYLPVLDAQRALFQGELTLARLRQRELATVVQLYRALGGGWTV